MYLLFIQMSLTFSHCLLLPTVSHLRVSLYFAGTSDIGVAMKSTTIISILRVSLYHIVLYSTILYYTIKPYPTHGLFQLIHGAYYSCIVDVYFQVLKVVRRSKFQIGSSGSFAFKLFPDNVSIR